MTSATYAVPARDLGPSRRRTASSAHAALARRPAAQRRAIALIALLVVVFATMVVLDRGGAQASLADQVAGHVVVQPGETLWDVAVATAPEGIDARQQLADLRGLNGLDDDHVGEWTVLLVPAR